MTNAGVVVWSSHQQDVHLSIRLGADLSSLVSACLRFRLFCSAFWFVIPGANRLPTLYPERFSGHLCAKDLFLLFAAQASRNGSFSLALSTFLATALAVLGCVHTGFLPYPESTGAPRVVSDAASVMGLSACLCVTSMSLHFMVYIRASVLM